MTDLAIGPFPSFLQSCALGSGYPQQIDVYKQSFPVTAKSHQIILTPSAPAWKKNCIWKEEGVWKWDAKKKEAKILRSGRAQSCFKFFY